MFGFAIDSQIHSEYVQVPASTLTVLQPPAGLYSAVKSAGPVRFDLTGIAIGSPNGVSVIKHPSAKFGVIPIPPAASGPGISAAIIVVDQAAEARGFGGAGANAGTSSGVGDHGAGGGGAGNQVGAGGGTGGVISPPSMANPGAPGTDGAGGAGGLGAAFPGRTQTFFNGVGADGGGAIALGFNAAGQLDGPDHIYLANHGLVWGGGGGGAAGASAALDGHAGGGPGQAGVPNAGGQNGAAGPSIRENDGNAHTATLLIGGSSPDLEGPLDLIP